jgi:predicted MFS family arabinose efflux permease
MDRNLRWLGFGVGVRSLGNALYFPFLALFLHAVLGVGYLELGALILLVGVVQVPFGFLGGLVTDRVGRRRLILLGLATEAAATAGLAYAFEVGSLLLAVLAAVAGGTIATLAGAAFSAYIADFTSGSDRTVGFTWFRIGFNAGYSAGVTLGGLLIGSVGFPGAVAVAALVMGGGTLLLLALLDPSPFDRAIAARRAVPAPGASAPPGRSLGQSLAVIARDRVALEVAVGLALGGLLLGQWAVTFPLFVHNVLGVSYELLGIGLALNGLIVVFGQSWTTRSVLGRRHTSIAMGGLGLYLLAFLGLGAAGYLGFFPAAAFFAAVAVLTVGENLFTIPMSTLPSNLAPAGEVGAYNGAFQTITGAASLLAVLMGGWVLSLTANPLLIWIYLTLPAVPGFVLLRHARSRIRPELDRA